MSKQDRTAARTAQDLERKYNYGKTFAEVFGLMDEVREAAEDALEAVGNLDNALTPEEIFNRLTDNGKVQGIYRYEDGQIYINASYLVTGILASRDGETFYLDLDNGVLKGKFAELSLSGKPVVTQESLDDYASEITKEIENLQSQIDGNITSWFGDYVPTTSNEPASNWTTEELKNQHLGDLFYINEDAEQGGTAYRWALVNGTYSWVIVEDTDVAKALAAAAKAQDTADSKRRVFVAQPTPPYDVGDLWAQGSGGDLMRCKTARASGSYVASDWELASKYIDASSASSIAQGKVDAQTQTDIFNKLTNNGADQGIYLKDGKVYLNASYIMAGVLDAALVTVKNLIADRLKSVSGNDILQADGAELKLYNGENLSFWLVNDLYGSPILGLFDTVGSSSLSPSVLKLGYSKDNSVGGVELDGSVGQARLRINREATAKDLSWKDNHDGSFNLIGGTPDPSKKKLWTGSCAIGGTITVPNTANYDLFAIHLGDSSGAFSQTILAYKSGTQVSGVGGWSGTSVDNKALHFVTFTANGNSWYLEDCRYHEIFPAGTVQSGVTAQVREIYGVL